MSDKDKKSFVLRVNKETLKEITEWASAEFRSTNGQIEYILEAALKAKKKKKDQPPS